MCPYDQKSVRLVCKVCGWFWKCLDDLENIQLILKMWFMWYIHILPNKNSEYLFAWSETVLRTFVTNLTKSQYISTASRKFLRWKYRYLSLFLRCKFVQRSTDLRLKIMKSDEDFLPIALFHLKGVWGCGHCRHMRQFPDEFMHLLRVNGGQPG